MAGSLKAAPKVRDIYPSMVYTGFKAPPMAVLRYRVTETDESPVFGCIVGTLEGSIEWLPLVKGGSPTVIYQHQFDAQVLSLVQVPTTSEKFHFAAQFRGEEVILFELNFKSDDEKPTLTVLRKLASSHPGFCHILVDNVKNSIILPSQSAEEVEGITIHYENGGEKSLVFGADFLFDSFQKQHPDTTLKTENCLKGSIMCMELIEDGPVTTEKRLLAAFEDSSIFVFDFLTKQVTALFKPPPKYCQLIGFTTHKEDNRLVIAVSVMSRVFELVYENGTFELTKKIRTTGYVNVECSQLAFTSNGDYLVCAFSSGKVEFYRRPDYQLERAMFFHKTKVFAFKLTSTEDETGRLFIGDEGGQLSEMPLQKLNV
uniref:WD_REPEATS_REGION domain-containing protein n=1 Tax=Panagrellus redivivus TaxID=6233 RepID=A0A7E4UW24_PANRE